MKSKIMFINLIIVAIVVLLFGCEKTPEQKLIGVWYSMTDDDEFIEFSMDRIGVWSDNGDQEPMTYELFTQTDPYQLDIALPRYNSKLYGIIKFVHNDTLYWDYHTDLEDRPKHFSSKPKRILVRK